jgi:hypothetical protein
MTQIDLATRGRALRWRPILWSIPVLLLLLPAIAMQFTDEVDWTIFDFVFAAIMFGITGLIVELTVRASRSFPFRVAVFLALSAGFLIIWINGAVGIIGDEDNPANLMFGAVLAVAILGSIASLFRPKGMALTMFAAAAVEIAVGGIALAGGMASGPAAPYDVIVATVVLAAIWLLSGTLFRISARSRELGSNAS